jgi:hypothetical protein
LTASKTTFWTHSSLLKRLSSGGGSITGAIGSLSTARARLRCHNVVMSAQNAIWARISGSGFSSAFAASLWNVSLTTRGSMT